MEEYDTRGMCERDLREVAVSIEHLMTHFPKNPYCDAHERARLRRKANRRRKEPREVKKEFGLCVTMDHVYAHTKTIEGIDGSSDMLVIYDIGTEKIDAYPAKSKSAEDTHEAIWDFRGTTYLQQVYSDNSNNIKTAVRQFGFRRRTSTPCIPQTNSLAEGRVRIVIYGARSALGNAGLPSAYWPYAARHFCFS